MASHEELVSELQKLEKLSHAARLKQAKKRRQKQLKKYQEWLRYDRQTLGTVTKKRTPPSINFENGAVLNDLVSRNDMIGVSKVLERGANPNISNADGLTPLHKCCIDNALEMAEIILEHGVDLNARDIEGWTALHAAAATGNIQMINLLIEEGASLVAINNDDKMPLDVAADGDIRYVLQQKMIEAGYTEDVLEYIRVSVPKTMLADLKDSVKNNRDLNMQDKYGCSALHIAAANGYSEVVEFLLANGEVEVNIADNDGWTPFHAAVCWSRPEMMRRLVEKGANMDYKNTRGETPFVIAEDPEIRQLILELKGQYGQPLEVSLEDMTSEDHEGFAPRGRRMSVKRISQQAKNEMSKQAVQDEASLRRESMVQHDLQMSLLEDKGKAVSDVVAAEEEDETAVLVRLKSFSVATEASKVSPPPSTSKTEIPLQRIEGDSSFLEKESDKDPTATGDGSTEEATKPVEGNDKTRKTEGTRPARFSRQEEPFNKTRKPRKSVLKRVDYPIARTNSTYDSSTAPFSSLSPPSSPSTVSTESASERGAVIRSPVREERKCCVVM